MSYGKVFETLMLMDDGVWQRHANPWSFWTRLAILPLLTIAVWSRAWLSWWCLVPIAAVVVWVWLNPRVFPRPATTDNWASKAVFGERVWLNRDAVPIAERHVHMANMLNLSAAIGLIPYAWGLVNFDLAMTLLGLAIIVGAKLWFLDRMVWLFEEMHPKHPQYAAWLR